MDEEIKKYYDDLASSYDSNRFNNSYGKYIDNQERAFLNSILSKNLSRKILDLGCGTGRFLDFANHAVDISPNMIKIAQQKFPNVDFRQGSVSNIPFEDNYFDCIFSFHVIMHLNSKTTEEFLKESFLKTNKNGIILFDFPSKKRRKLIQYKSKNWHASNELSIKEIKKMIGIDWKIITIQGILFLPIHRFPKATRRWFITIDNWLCKSFLKEYSSYLIIKLQKNAD